MKKSVLSLLFTIYLTTTAQAYQTEHAYSVFLGPFNASDANFTFDITPEKYLVNTNIQTKGIFNGLYPFFAEYKTTGTIQKNQLTPLSYKSDSKSRFNIRHKEMFYKDGQPTYRISTKNSSIGKKVEILPPPDNIRATDLQTALAEIIIQYQNLKFCNARLHIFDGKKQFDLIFNDEGNETLSANEQTPYQGTAHKCSIYADDLGQNYDDVIFQMTPKSPIYLWILEDSKTKKPFIAKLEKPSTPLGKLVVYINKIKIKE